MILELGYEILKISVNTCLSQEATHYLDSRVSSMLAQKQVDILRVVLRFTDDMVNINCAIDFLACRLAGHLGSLSNTTNAGLTSFYLSQLFCEILSACAGIS
jgi:hypothetical protein